MRKDRSECNNHGKDSKDFCTLSRKVLKGRKPVDELLECPVFKRRLMALCLLLTCNEWDAEELYNDVCIKLCKVLRRRFKPDYNEPYGNFFAWLRTVTRHMFFDTLRGRKAEFTPESLDDLSLEDPTVNIEEQFFWSERARQVVNAVRSLSFEKERTADLYVLKGYSTRETVDELSKLGIECSHATVRNWVREGLGPVFPDAEAFSLTELARKPNARASQRPISKRASKKGDEAKTKTAKVDAKKKAAKG